MATAYYFAAHGAHFPSAPTPPSKSTATPTSEYPALGIQHEQSAVHPAAEAAAAAAPPPPLKPTRTDSVIASPSAINNQLASLFFRLPAELRNQIYTTLLCAHTPSSLSSLVSSSSRPLPPPAQPHPSILLTCRRIHLEASPLLYTRPIFHAHPSLLTSLPHLFSSARPVLSPSAIQRIKRWQLTVRLDTDPRFTARQAADAFSGAEFLELTVRQSMFGGCGAGVLRLFLRVRGVQVARVVGSVEEGLARWLEGRMMMMVGSEDGEGKHECGCQGERWARCEACEGRVRMDGDGVGVWGDEGDAWRFGNR